MNLGGLGKQVGPLPLGVWLLVGGGGLWIAYRRSNAAPAAAAPAAGDPLPVGGGTDAQVSSWDGAPVVLSPVIQVAPPRIAIINTLPAPAPVTINVPAPIILPPAPPRVAPKPAPKPVATPAPKPAPVHRPQPWNRIYYRQGSVGPQVADIQRKVGATPDGIFGPKTAAAVRAFQSRNGLAADAIVGPLTWAKLYR